MVLFIYAGAVRAREMFLNQVGGVWKKGLAFKCRGE